MRASILGVLLTGCYSIKPLPPGAMLAGPSAFDGERRHEHIGFRVVAVRIGE